MWRKIHAYLTFTRKERLGILVLVPVILILFVTPYALQPKPGTTDEQAFKRYGADIRKFQTVSSENREGNKPSREAEMTNRFKENPSALAAVPPETKVAPAPFYFDPNLISGADWQRLGMPDKLILTITHYIQKGGHFLKAEDLKKLYGLGAEEYTRLFPYVRISAPLPRKFIPYPEHSPAIWKERQHYAFEKKPGLKIPGTYRKKMEDLDVNLADSSDWCQLPGIGIRLASRIIHFREKLGGFYTVDQVQETFGLADSTFRQLRPFLHIGSAGLQKIDLNNALPESLQSHPYIRWKLAREIIRYRDQHRGFKSVDELQQLAMMEPDQFKKLSPYLEVK